MPPCSGSHLHQRSSWICKVYAQAEQKLSCLHSAIILTNATIDFVSYSLLDVSNRDSFATHGIPESLFLCMAVSPYQPGFSSVHSAGSFALIITFSTALVTSIMVLTTFSNGRISLEEFYFFWISWTSAMMNVLCNAYRSKIERLASRSRMIC